MRSSHRHWSYLQAKSLQKETYDSGGILDTVQYSHTFSLASGHFKGTICANCILFHTLSSGCKMADPTMD